MNRWVVVTLAMIAMLAVAGAVDLATMSSGESVNAEAVVAQGCRYGNAALAQVQQTQAAPSVPYAATPDVGYLVEIEGATETSLTSSSAINQAAADAASVRIAWQDMVGVGAPQRSQILIAQIRTVINDCKTMGLRTSSK